VTFQTTLSAIPQTVVGRKHSGLTSTQTSQARLEAWMKTLLYLLAGKEWEDWAEIIPYRLFPFIY